MSNSLAQSLARKLNTTSTLGMESVDVDVNIGQDAILDEDGASVSPLAPATDEPILEAQQTELAEEESDIEQTESDSDDAESDIETLESIQVYLEKSLDHGGLDTASYEMFNLTMDHVYRKYGIEAQSVLPSMEAFNDDNVGQTTVSMEKVIKTTNSIMEGAVQLIKKMWFQLKEFLKGLFTFNLTVKKRAGAIIKAAQSLDSKAEGGEIKLFGAKYLMVKGKVPDKGSFIGSYTKMASSSVEITKTLSAQTVAYGKLVADAVRSARADKDESGDLDKTVDVITNYAEKLINLSDKMVFSNARFELVKFGVGEGKSLLSGVKLLTDKGPERGGDSDGYKIQALNPAEIQNVARAVEQLCDTLSTFDKSYNVKTMEDIVIKQLPLISEDKDGNASAFKMTRQIKKGIRGELSLQRTYLSFLGKVNKAALDYCAQSLNAVKKGGKKDTTEETK